MGFHERHAVDFSLPKATELELVENPCYAAEKQEYPTDEQKDPNEDNNRTIDKAAKAPDSRPHENKNDS